MAPGSRDFITKRLLLIRQFRLIIRHIVRGPNRPWPHERLSESVEVWAAWKYYCRHLARKSDVIYFEVLHRISRARWEIPFASSVTFDAAVAEINEHWHQLSSKTLDVAWRNTNMEFI